MLQDTFTELSIKTEPSLAGIGVLGREAMARASPSAEGIAGVDRLIAELDLGGLHSTATYLRNDGHDLFTVR